MPASPHLWNRVFKGSWQEISAAMCWVESVAPDLGLPDAKTYGMLVCVEELMTNIVRYGAEGAGAKGATTEPPLEPLQISLTLDNREDFVHMTLEDNGRPFDVTQAPAKVIDQPLEEVEIGGLGVGLIKAFSENLHYDRTEMGNRVSLQFMK